MSGLNHPMFVNEFADSAFVIRDDGGVVAAYLFGFTVPRSSLAYVHLVAVRRDQRGQGLARSLSATVREHARECKCTAQSDHQPDQCRVTCVSSCPRDDGGGGRALCKARTDAGGHHESA